MDGAGVWRTWWSVHGPRVWPVLLGSMLLVGAFTLVSNHVETTKDLHAEAVENERVQKELQTARKTQERFLPDEIPRDHHVF